MVKPTKRLVALTAALLAVASQLAGCGGDDAAGPASTGCGGNNHDAQAPTGAGGIVGASGDTNMAGSIGTSGNAQGGSSGMGGMGGSSGMGGSGGMLADAQVDAPADAPGDTKSDVADVGTTIDSSTDASADVSSDSSVEAASSDAAGDGADAGVATTSSILNSMGYSCLQCATDSCNNELTNLNCETLTGNAAAGPAVGQSKQDLCRAALSCEVGAAGLDCEKISAAYCYCGSGGGASCFTTGTTNNGGCRAVIENGLESTDPATIQSRYQTSTYAAGRANKLVQCMKNNGCFDPGGAGCFP